MGSVRLCYRGRAVWGDPNAKSVAGYICRKVLFTVLLDEITLAYVDGTLFRDEALFGGGENFLRHLIAEPLLAGATSEKGVFANDQQSFSGGSVFQIVVDRDRKSTRLNSSH